MAKVRAGFTLREMLLVIGIICVLLAILVPQIRSARESAQRVSCVNNLRQIAIALENYHDVLKTLPVGASWRSNAKENRGSVLLKIQWAIRSSDFYSTIDFTIGTDDRILPNGMPLCSTVDEAFLCPADFRPRLVNGVAFSNYSASHGSSGLSNNPDCFCKNDWNKFAQVPYEQTSGMFTRLGESYSKRDCTDGLSHTIFFGEVLPDCSVHVQNGWTRTNNSQGLCSTIIPINYDTCEAMGKGNACHQPCNWSTELGFRSKHPGGCFFSMGDASVKFLSEDIDHHVYQYLGGARDGHGKGLR